MSCQLADAIDEVCLRVRKQFPYVAGHVLESVLETLWPVLLCHVPLAFDDSDVDRFLIPLHNAHHKPIISNSIHCSVDGGCEDSRS